MTEAAPATKSSRPVDSPRGSRWLRWLVRGGLSFVVLLNAMAFMQARGMCRYEPANTPSMRFARFTAFDKARLIAFGPTVRRQSNVKTPADFGMRYQTERFPGAHGIELEAWRIDGRTDRPTVFLFPGYGGSKDTLLRAAAEFHALGFPLWMVDFHGIGGSAGNTTTIGYDEADDVAAVVARANVKRVVLYGASMGAVAALRAVHLGKVKPEKMILEAPFDRFLNTIGNRFDALRLPQFPMAHLLVFWSGTTNGFNGYRHNPLEYARSVECPILLMQGEHDEMVGREVPAMFAQVFGERGTVKVIPDARHAFLFNAQPTVWRGHVKTFLGAK